MKSSPLTDTGLCNGTALRKATRRVSQRYDDALAPCGLRSTQHSLLAHVARAGSPTLSALADALVMDRSALGHTLKPLERDGFVASAPNLEDGRSRLVVLTDAGRAKLSESQRLWSEAQARFERAFGMEDAKALRQVLATLASIEFVDAFDRAPPKASAGHRR